MSYFRRFLYYFCMSCRPHRSRTVRIAFPMLFAAMVFLSAAALMFDNVTYLRLATTKQHVRAGETFSINVYVGAHVPINAVDIRLSFPDDQLEILGIDTGESVITLWTQEPSVVGNQVVLSGGTFRKGFIGEHLVATVNVKALSSGEAKFNADEVTLLAGDGSGREVSLDDAGTNSLVIQVAPENGQISSEVAILIVTDIDGDGSVNLADVLSFLEAWGSRRVLYDFNHDSQMTFVDFSIILADSFFK